MNTTYEQTQVQLETQFFEGIDVSQFTPEIQPNITKLAKALKHVKKEMSCGNMKVKVYPFHIEVYLKNIEVTMKPFGVIYIRSECFEGELNWHDVKENERLVSLEFSRGEMVEILFYGYFEVEVKPNSIKICLRPKSKIWVF